MDFNGSILDYILFQPSPSKIDFLFKHKQMKYMKYFF